MSAGAWSAEILEGLPGPALPLRPIRGQIEVFQTDGSTVRHIFFAGKSYVVPREDGLVLIGATEEDAGFDKSVTADGLASLHQFAINLIPRLADAPVIHSWAGLRPASAVGHPILGPWAGLDRLWIATGHFRHGLQQSPGTAQLIADWIVGSDTFARPEDFSLEAHPAQFVSAFHS
jgi:glycine oxidase